MLLVRRSLTRSLTTRRAFTTSFTHRQSVEEHVCAVRAQYGHYLPENLLSQNELEVYERYYGAPLRFLKPGELEEMERLEQGVGVEGVEEGTVVIEAPSGEVFEVRAEYEEVEEEEVYAPITPLEEEELDLVAEEEEFDDEEYGGLAMRVHPLTQLGQFRTQPKTILAPKSVKEPTSKLLSEVNNKHLDAATYRVFDGQSLAKSPLLTRRSEKNYNGFPLDTAKHMGDMEANVYLATVLPGYYAQALSALTELRRRMGGDWVLGRNEGEPGVKLVLDVGGGGAGVLAWRDIVVAEQATRNEAFDPEAPGPESKATLEELVEPGGLKATVVASSEALRYRMKNFLENTTFIPHLPDTKEPSSEQQPRKLYDFIISTNSLLPLYQDHQRKFHIQNLWSLLNPNGGVLLLIEKGTPAGFEAIAGARERLLSEQLPDLRIIAPCTTHETCPMFINGPAKGARKDWCRFTQRYERPGYMQRVIKATMRNHEDIEYSYVAMRRTPERQKEPLPEIDPALFDESRDLIESPYSMPQLRRHALTLPRLVFPPMKRHGHVILDVCTPAGQIERWTVPRSYGNTAYRDARKSKWGDLWALGAKTKVKRNLKLGEKRAGPKIQVVRVMDADQGDVKEIVKEKDRKGGKKKNPGKREGERRQAKRLAQLAKQNFGVKKDVIEGEEEEDDDD